jgi:hypothetical protein
MKNYHFTGPPPPGSIPSVDPVVAELRQIQNMVLSIMRKADFNDDWEAALFAAGQAFNNAQLIGTIQERLKAAASTPTGAEARNAPGPTLSIALNDHTIESATVYWTDGLMLHFLTPRGAHVQVRMDLVDRNLTNRLNSAAIGSGGLSPL